MAYVMQMSELGDGTRLRDLCGAGSDPVFVSSGDKEEFVVLNMNSYKELFAKLQVYQRLEEGERDIAAGRESDAFAMLDSVLGGTRV